MSDELEFVDNPPVPVAINTDSVKDEVAEEDTKNKKASEGLQADLAKARREKNAHAKRAEQLEAELNELKRSGMTDLEKLKAEKEDLARMFEDLKAEHNRTKVERARAEIIAEVGLPSELSKFLVGEDTDELRDSANELMKFVNNKPARPKNDAGKAASSKPPAKDRESNDPNDRFKAGIRDLLNGG